jgi:4-hydroxy-tetrahydrodipicolinate synthase
MEKRKKLVSGIVASNVTPFGADGTLRLDLLKPHIDWLIEQGVDGLSPLGSSGEFAALEINDRKRVLEAVLEANNGRKHIMAGTHHVSTMRAIELSKHAQQAGADSLLMVAPYYGLPSIRQTQDHYRRVAEAVDIPIVLYHSFVSTYVNLRTEHLMELFREQTISGVKMSNPEPDRICELLQATDWACIVYAGLDTVAFEGLCHGAHGWISGIPSIVPRTAKNLYELIAKSDLPAARLLWKKLAPLMRLQFRGAFNGGDDPNWLSVMKATLNLVGPPIGNPSLPGQPLDPATTRLLASILRDLGYQVPLEE